MARVGVRHRGQANMDNKVNYALVGLFVILLTASMIITTLWLTASTDEKVFTTYQIFIGESVSGLNEKAVVKYRGVEVGNVVDIRLVPERPSEVSVLVKIEASTPIKEDTMATLATQGLTGLAYIELSGGSRTSKNLLIRKGQAYPEIKSKPSLLVRLDSAISLLLKNLGDVTDVAHRLIARLYQLSETATRFLSEETRISMQNTLHNIEVLTETFAQRAPNIDQSILYTEQTLKHSERIAAQLPDVLSQLQTSLAAFETTNVQVTTTVKHVDTVISQNEKHIRTASRNVAQAGVQLKKSIASSGKDVNQFTRQALPESLKVLREMNQVLRQLRTLTQELERKPNMFVFGKQKAPRGPGE